MAKHHARDIEEGFFFFTPSFVLTPVNWDGVVLYISRKFYF